MNLQEALDLTLDVYAELSVPQLSDAESLVRAAARRLLEAQTLVNTQAEDEGLWFRPRTAPEKYLQQELRRLHDVVEKE